MTSKALVVLSGGQDSCTCLGLALNQYDEVHCITFDYGQRHAREIQAARDVVTHFELHYKRPIPHEVVAVPDVLVGTSPLVKGGDELATYGSVQEMTAKTEGRVEATFVPMRNQLFLTLAANRAVAIDADYIVTGVCQEDHGGYWDCREEFIRSLQATINLSLGRTNNPDGDDKGYPLEIVTPLMHLSKAQTVLVALDTPYTYAALAWSHTAYDGQYPPVGKDHASVLRAYGFEQAGKPDPLVLRAVHEGLMPMPETANYGSLGHAMHEALRPGWELMCTHMATR